MILVVTWLVFIIPPNVEQEAGEITAVLLSRVTADRSGVKHKGSVAGSFINSRQVLKGIIMCCNTEALRNTPGAADTELNLWRTFITGPMNFN